jgi:hypothetical protein
LDESFVVAIDAILFSFSINLPVRLYPIDRIIQEVFVSTTIPSVALHNNHLCRQNRKAENGEGLSTSFSEV